MAPILRYRSTNASLSRIVPKQMRNPGPAIAVLLLAQAAHSQSVESILAEVERRTHSQSVRYRGVVQTVADNADQAPGQPEVPASSKSWAFERRGTRGHSKTLIRFIAPDEIKGVQILILDQKDSLSGEWIYTPSSGRVRRIVAAPEVRLLGFDIKAELLEEPDFSRFTARLLPDATLDGTACWKIELRSKPDMPSPYESSTLWVRQDNYFVARVENFYGSTMARRIVNQDPRKVQDIWTPSAIEVWEPAQNRRTILRLDEVAYNIDLDDKLFTLPGGLPDASGGASKAPCVFMLQPQNVTAPASGSAGIILVNTQAGCTWSATANVPWIAIEAGTGAGAPTGAVSFRISPNSSPAERAAEITVGSRTVAIRQGGVVK